MITREATVQKIFAALRFIREHMKTHTRSPTYAQIAAGIGNRSKSNIAGILTELERRGHIRFYGHGCYRSFHLVDPVIHISPEMLAAGIHALEQHSPMLWPSEAVRSIYEAMCAAKT
jgi:SOS-response transcriptional repressor LexA